MELRRPHLGWGGHSLRVGGGGRRSQGREDPKPGIPSILWCLCSLCSHQLLCPPCPPHQVDPNPPMGKLRQRPHSKFSGLKPALELPLPLASSSNLDGGLRRPGRGIPRAQAAFQPATHVCLRPLPPEVSTETPVSLGSVTQQFHPNASAPAATKQCLPWAVGCPLPKSHLK